MTAFPLRSFLSTACAGTRAVLVAAAALAAALPFDGAWAQSRPTPVIIAPVKVKTLVDRVEALGTLRANESVSVTSQVTEIITSIKFEDGARVKAGQVLALMTSQEEEAQLREADATMREAEEQLERIRPLAKKGVSSAAIFAERRRDYETAKARHEAVKWRIADRRIVAPFAGVVGLRRISVGALVEPGTVITTIDDDAVMKLDFTVPATFLSTIRVGLPIVAEAEAFPGQSFEGKVTGIDSRVDAVTRSITVRAMIPNPDGILKAGVLMVVEVHKNERQAAVIPEQAIIALGRENYVLVVNPDAASPMAEKRKIETRARADGNVEVIEGLQAGDYVITEGTLRAQPGKPVTIRAVDRDDAPLSDLLKQRDKNPS